MKNFIGKLTVKGIKTRKYDFLKFDETNREIDDEILYDLKNDLCEGISEHEYPFYAPIVCYWKPVMKHAIIQQGHHRFCVCKELNRDIHYVITDNYRQPSRGQEEAHQDWKTKDLVESYVKEGIEDYKLLYKLYNENPKYSLIALTAMINGKICDVKRIRKREFKIENTNIDVERIAKDRIEKYDTFLKISQRSDRGKELITALIRACEREDFNFNYFIERSEKNASEIKIMHDFKSISTKAKAEALIQKYYNYKSRKNFFF